jgi:hypothetical protein
MPSEETEGASPPWGPHPHGDSGHLAGTPSARWSGIEIVRLDLAEPYESKRCCNCRRKVDLAETARIRFVMRSLGPDLSV